MHAIFLRTAAALAVSAACAVTFASPSSAVPWRDGGDAGPIRRDGGGVIDEGRLNSRTFVTVSVWLRYQHEAELGQLVALQSTRGTAYYHQYLSTAQWNNYFAPSWWTVAATIRSLNARGLRVTYVAPNRDLIVAAGPASLVERAFATELHAVAQPGRGMKIANVRPAIVPREIAPAVVTVTGLDTIERMHTNVVRAGETWRPRQALPRPMPILTQSQARAPQSIPILPRPAAYSTSTPAPGLDTPLPIATPMIGGGYCPGVIANAYHAPVQHGYGGTSFNVANIMDTHTFNSELQANYSNCSFPSPGPALPSRKYTKVSCMNTTVPAESDVSGCEVAVSVNRDMSPDVLEANLDAASIQGMAPWANFFEYIIPDLSNGSLAQAVNVVAGDNIAKTVNLSIGGCEADDPNSDFLLDYLASQLVAKGITLTAASGDNGSFGCGGGPNGSLGPELGVDSPASGLFVVSAGGTHITTSSTSPFALTSESAWNRAGGGISSIYSAPSWQKLLSPAVNPGLNPNARNVPDIALPADPGFGGINQCAGGAGSCKPVGGTSESSPLFTGMLVTIEQACSKPAGLGDVHAFLYALYAGDQAHTYFHFRDITTGNNGTTQFYSAVAGFDDASGMGAPLGFEIAGTGCN